MLSKEVEGIKQVNKPLCWRSEKLDYYDVQWGFPGRDFQWHNSDSPRNPHVYIPFSELLFLCFSNFHISPIPFIISTSHSHWLVHRCIKTITLFAYFPDKTMIFYLFNYFSCSTSTIFDTQLEEEICLLPPYYQKSTWKSRYFDSRVKFDYLQYLVPILDEPFTSWRTSDFLSTTLKCPCISMWHPSPHISATSLCYVTIFFVTYIEISILIEISSKMNVSYFLPRLYRLCRFLPF